MKEKLDLVKFNLTNEMSKELIKFNKLKKELNKIKSKEIKDEIDVVNLKELEDKLNEVRINFIKEFRNNNKAEINEYLQIKDQI